MAPRDGEWFVSATFTKEGDRYITGGLGECRPTAVLGRRSPMTWELARSVGRDSDTIDVLATEIECASARSPSPDQIDAPWTTRENKSRSSSTWMRSSAVSAPGTPRCPSLSS